MSLNRRQFNRAFLAALTAGALPGLLAAGSASAQAIELVEGRDWAAIVPPQKGSSPGKIEVLEFFSYGCSHCSDLNPLIHRWEKSLAKDVEFRRVPVTFGRAAWSNLARIFYALETSKQLDKLDQAVFDAIHLRKTSLFTEQAAMDWAASQGVDAKAFRDSMRSFAVETRLARADALARAYKVASVPNLVVDGRYTVLGKTVRNVSGLLDITDALIERVRQEKRGKR